MSIYATFIMIIGGAVLVMALLLMMGESDLIRTLKFTAVRDKKAYTKFIGKFTGSIGLVMILSGLLSELLNTAVSVILMVMGIVLVFVFFIKRSGEYYR